MPGGFVLNGWSVGFLDHLAFHLHIDLKIDVCSVDVCVPKPVADHVDIIS